MVVELPPTTTELVVVIGTLLDSKENSINTSDWHWQWIVSFHTTSEKCIFFFNRVYIVHCSCLKPNKPQHVHQSSHIADIRLRITYQTRNVITSFHAREVGTFGILAFEIPTNRIDCRFAFAIIYSFSQTPTADEWFNRIYQSKRHSGIFLFETVSCHVNRVHTI